VAKNHGSNNKWTRAYLLGVSSQQKHSLDGEGIAYDAIMGGGAEVDAEPEDATRFCGLACWTRGGGGGGDGVRD
jgi:hypothetical protein